MLAAARAGGLDVILLDIHMPGLSGLDALSLLPEDGPGVILCTAHAEHAVDAFEYGAVDYVLKPVEAARLQKALERARARMGPKEGAQEPAKGTASAGTKGLTRLPIPTRQGIVLVDPETISHATLEGELVTVFTTQGEFLTDFTLQRAGRQAAGGGLPTGAPARAAEPGARDAAGAAGDGGLHRAHGEGHSVEVSRQSARELRRMLGLRKGADEDSSP